MFTLTKEQMKSAKTYMPLRDKAELAKQIAGLCLVDMKTAEQNRAGLKIVALPCLKEEDLAVKYILLQNTLLWYYFNIEINPEDKNGYDVYDSYACGNLMNQIERFKSDSELKDKAFDLLADFRDFRKMVDTEIYNRKANENDPIGRFTAAIQLISNPENMKQFAEILKQETEKAEIVHERKD
mgnify:FL=1